MQSTRKLTSRQKTGNYPQKIAYKLANYFTLSGDECIRILSSEEGSTTKSKY